jgi:hypothetical protein
MRTSNIQRPTSNIELKRLQFPIITILLCISLFVVPALSTDDASKSIASSQSTTSPSEPAITFVENGTRIPHGFEVAIEPDGSLFTSSPTHLMTSEELSRSIASTLKERAEPYAVCVVVEHEDKTSVATLAHTVDKLREIIKSCGSGSKDVSIVIVSDALVHASVAPAVK